MRNFLIRLLATFFYVGYLPLIPGTFGSLAGILIFYLIKGNPLTYLLVTLILIVLGFASVGQAERLMQTKDPRYIVIDEVCGMLLSFLFIPYDIKLVIIGFLLFRILDTLKPYPAGSLERVRGSVGIMSDDIIAGLYTNIILQIVVRFISFKTS
ncbi:MAG: phosphatidylglycerophosphatase A [Candidatus Omnitrophica bacterium]|nr:phosphatidylglycerophosphatase A [Candidatus Omnitrophota bacterium]